MVELKSPTWLKHVKGKFAILFNLLSINYKKNELNDTTKIVTINLKKNETIALIDKKGDFWQLKRNKNGKYTIAKLKNKRRKT